MPGETRNDLDTVSTTYGRVAARYADQFLDELAGKPLDRALLDAFAEDVRARGGGRVADLGTGSGQIARYLHDRGGLDGFGIDVSPEMVAEAARRHGDTKLGFEIGDFTRLAAPDASWAGATAFYAIVHLTRAELAPAFAEVRRVLAPRGAFLLAWHVGDVTLRPEDFLGEPCPIAWNFFSMADVVGALEAGGLRVEARLERAPYATEHASTRGYVLARRP